MRRTILAGVAMLVVSSALVGAAIARPPDFCDRHPNNPNCQPDPIPTPPPTPTMPPPSDCVQVMAPASIQNAINANPTGTSFCLSGTFHPPVTILPKAGQSFFGPASIVGPGLGAVSRPVDEPNDFGFENRSQAPNTTFVNLDMSGWEIALRCHVGTLVQGGRYHDNERVGIGCGLAQAGGVAIMNVEIDHNGSIEWLGHSSSGVKLAGSNGSVLRDNFAHHNVGNGLWCDVDCRGDLFEDNIVSNNTRAGIHYEISLGLGVFRGNTTNFNNTSGNNPSAGIYLNSSEHALIEDNVSLGNQFHDINIRDDSREYNAPFDIIIRNNDVTAASEVDGCSISGVACSGNV